MLYKKQKQTNIEFTSNLQLLFKQSYHGNTYNKTIKQQCFLEADHKKLCNYLHKGNILSPKESKFILAAAVLELPASSMSSQIHAKHKPSVKQGGRASRMKIT